MKRVFSILMVLTFVFTSMFGNLSVSAAAESDIQITDLKVEYMTNPIGIDVAQPRFSWNMESATIGQKQIAYQILVSSSADGDGNVWDSEKVVSDKSVAVKYGGDALEASTRYYWKVIVWDKDSTAVTSEAAYFETGLMSADSITNWDGAKWISMDDSLSSLSVTASVYTTGSAIVTGSSIVFGAKDSDNYYYWQFGKNGDGNLTIQPKIMVALRSYDLIGDSFNISNSTPAAIVVDTVNANSEFKVKIDYSATDKSFITSINDNVVSTISDPSYYIPSVTYPGWGTIPASKGSISTITKNSGAGMMLPASNNLTTYFDDFSVKNDGEVLWDTDFENSDNIFNNGSIVDVDGNKKLSLLSPNSGSMLVLPNDFKAKGAPMLRKETTLTSGKTVNSARLYISALGAYDAYINGKKLGIVNADGSTTYELLNPGWTNYDTNINYITYDVTSYIKDSSAATLAVNLGNGWYNGRISGSSRYIASTNVPGLMAKLKITYEDGTTQNVVTDTTSGWRATDTGPIVANDIWNGDQYDATREIPGWDDNDFDDSSWYPVKIHDFRTKFPNSTLTAKIGNTVHIVDSLDQTPISITTYTGIKNVGNNSAVKSGLGEIDIDSTRTFLDREASIDKNVDISSGDTVIYDLGQNMVGVSKLTFKGPAGTKLKMRYAEMVNDDSVQSGSLGADGPKGTLYTVNLRGAEMCTDYYTLKGDPNGETYQPVFTYRGYRYIEVSVVSGTGTITISDVTGKVATSAIDSTGSIETSDSDVNKFFMNQVWSQRGNFSSIPTDCPQRAERQGWTGDVQLFSNTAMYNADSAQFFENFMNILVDSQNTYGNGQFFQTVSPGAQYTGNAAHSGWSDVGVILPWTVWQMTGDKTIISSHYEAMEKYMNYLYSLTGTTYRGPGSQYGDWLAFQGTSSRLISDMYYAYDAKLMAEMATRIGNSSDASKYTELFNNIKNAIISNYITIDSNGKITVLSGKEPSTTLVGQSGISENNSQTALLWCLKLGVYSNDDQKQQMVDMLVENIGNSDAYKAANPTSARNEYAQNTLSVGFLGVNVIAPVLSDVGQSDLAYALLLQDKMPSWLYEVKNGATSIWERWNSYSIEQGFGDSSMNSFNHFSYGAVAEWMYKYMAGIMYDQANPGFKHIILQPTIDPQNRITWVKGSYDSVYGTIKSDWSVSDNIMTYEAKVPANTTATLSIPAYSENSVKINTGSTGAAFVKYEDGKAVYELESGSYSFTSNLTAVSESEKVVAPTATPAAGTYSSTQTVSLSSTTAGASIYYTTDGSTPTTSSTLYSSAITVSKTSTIKAIAVKDGMTNSEVATFAYTIKSSSSSHHNSSGSSSSDDDEDTTTPTEPAEPTTPADTDTDTTTPTQKTFSDMSKHQWAKEAVEALASEGIISGTSATIFEPGKNISRADFLTILIKALNLKADFTDNFADVNSSAYYYQAVGIAKQLGITNGAGNNKFNPKAEISRQDMMVLVVKALKIAGVDIETGTASDMSGFVDASRVSSYAEDAVATLIKEGIISGSNNAINPKSHLTRAEAAVVIYKIYKK